MTAPARPRTLSERLTPGDTLTVVDNQFNGFAIGRTYVVLERPDNSGHVLIAEDNRPPFRWKLPAARTVTWDGDLFTYPVPVDPQLSVTYRHTHPDTTEVPTT